MDKYFAKFPNIYYANTLCKDITRRAHVNQFANTMGTMDLFYPFQIVNHARPDHIASDYYKDPEQDWLIYLANEVIDPYYEWYQSQDIFEALIEDKYTTSEVAQRTVMYWTCNWAEDDNSLTPSYYENNLDTRWRKYYEPYWGQNSRIVNYVRKQQDIYMNTNKIVIYEVPDTSDFTVGEPIIFHNVPVLDPTPLDAECGQGRLAAKTDTSLYVWHVLDEYLIDDDNGKQLQGMVSNTYATATSSTILVTNIEDDERVFWTAVSAYDIENEKNEIRKDINLVATGGNSLLSQKITEKLRENVDPTTNLVIE